MDDIKLYAKSKKELHKLIGDVKVFPDQIKMKFGLDKCKIVNVVRGKLNPSHNYLNCNQVKPSMR